MKREPNGRGGLVYSTDTGRMCPTCRRPIADCICRRTAATVTGDGVVRVSREMKGRAGKGVTVVRGLAMNAAALHEAGRALRAACGAGGTEKDGAVEIQGDHVERVMALLQAQGRTVKRAGG
jgi:translation initiation factor 1